MPTVSPSITKNINTVVFSLNRLCTVLNSLHFFRGITLKNGCIKKHTGIKTPMCLAVIRQLKRENPYQLLQKRAIFPLIISQYFQQFRHKLFKSRVQGTVSLVYLQLLHYKAG